MCTTTSEQWWPRGSCQNVHCTSPKMPSIWTLPTTPCGSTGEPVTGCGVQGVAVTGCGSDRVWQHRVWSDKVSHLFEVFALYTRVSLYGCSGNTNSQLMQWTFFTIIFPLSASTLTVMQVLGDSDQSCAGWMKHYFNTKPIHIVSSFFHNSIHINKMKVINWMKNDICALSYNLFFFCSKVYFSLQEKDLEASSQQLETRTKLLSGNDRNEPKELSSLVSGSLFVCVYMYVCICVCMYVYISTKAPLQNPRHVPPSFPPGTTVVL